MRIDVKKFETKKEQNILHKEFNIPQGTLIVEMLPLNQPKIFISIGTAKSDPKKTSSNSLNLLLSEKDH
jgi:hypothetical protein